MNQKMIDYNIKIGTLQSGPRNSISDVSGVTVGHKTLSDNDIQTGVTAILPHQGNLFRDKLVAASHVINGFGKTTGITHINELGTLESPILLTNTLSVGTVQDALIKYILNQTPEIGRSTGTVNPVVGECNDMVLNDIRLQSIQKNDVFDAIQNAAADFEEGAVGAGRGMVCYSLKGGIGSASRVIQLDHGTYTLGTLVLSNFGYITDLTINGRKIGTEIKDEVIPPADSNDKGSIMIIVATDLPVSHHQLKRIIKRGTTGLARTGSIIGHGSGDIVIGFSTANTVPHTKPASPESFLQIHDSEMDETFRAMGESVEEAVLNSLINAESVTGRDRETKRSLKEFLNR